MPLTKSFYCWVKLSDAAAPADPAAGAGAPVTQAQATLMSSGLLTLNGGVPPHVVAELGMPGAMNGGVPPGRLAGAMSAGYWSIDEQYTGIPSAGLIVDYAPAMGSRDQAMAWLDSHGAWLVNATTYFLMVFTMVSGD